jgi:hypothetical protein
VKILIVTMMALEIVTWSYFSNGMTLYFYNWSYSFPCRKGDQGQPTWAPAWVAAAGITPNRYGFMASDALLEPSTGQCQPLGPSVYRHWSRFSAERYISMHWDQHWLQIRLRWGPSLLLCTVGSTSCGQFFCGFCFNYTSRPSSSQHYAWINVYNTN